MQQKVYIVTAFRRIRGEDHNYLVGVFSSAEKALLAADFEEEYRAWKYECEVLEYILDERIDHSVVVVKSLSNKS